MKMPPRTRLLFCALASSLLLGMQGAAGAAPGDEVYTRPGRIVPATQLPPLPPRPGQPHRTCEQQFFRGLPETQWSSELNTTVLQIARTKVAMYDAYVSEMEQMPSDEAWLQRYLRYLGSRPVRIITTGNHGVGHLPARNAHDPKHVENEHQIARAQAC